MRLACSSDFQLGAGSDYGAAPGSRLQDQHAVLLELAEKAAEHSCEAVLFAGDAFQHRRPSIAELMVFRSFLFRCRELGLQVIGCGGNHDASGPALPNALDVFREKPQPWFYTDAPGLTYVESPRSGNGSSGDGLYVCALPWVHPGTLRAANEGAADPLEQARKLEEIARALSRGGERPAPRVLVLHWALSGCSLPGNLPTSALKEPVLDVEELLSQGWLCVVAGHIHKQQKPAPSVIVCGSPAVVDFGEAHLQHGFWVIDSEAPDGAPFPVQLSDRAFTTIEVAGPEPPILAAGEPLREAVVRVRWKGSAEDAARLDVERLRRALYEAGAHKVFAVELDVQDAGRRRIELSSDEELGPEEALLLWLEAQDADPQAELSLAMLARHARYLEEAS